MTMHVSYAVISINRINVNSEGNGGQKFEQWIYTGENHIDGVRLSHRGTP